MDIAKQPVAKDGADGRRGLALDENLIQAT
jgi:hypothetical protein